MKKTLALLLALVMLFALAACGGGESGAGSSDSGSSAGSQSSGGGSQSSGGASQSSDAGSQQQEEEPAVELTGDPIVLGHIADLTGVEAMTGIESVTAMDFAVKMIEAAGGIDGRPIEIIHEDSQSSTPAAADAARKLIENDKVLAILGPTQAGHKGSVGGVVSELGVPAIYYNGTPYGMAKGNPYVVSSGGSTNQLPTCMADYLYNEMGWRKVYTITQDNTGGQNYMNPFIEDFTAYGGEVVESMWVASGVSDFTSYLSAMTAEVDGLVAWFSGSDAIKLWTTWYDLGLDRSLPMVGSMHGGFTDYFILESLEETNPDVVDAILECAVVPVAYSYTADNDANKAFVEAWEKEFGETPGATNLPGATYGALSLVKAAIESIDGELTSEAIYQALTKQDLQVPEGHLRFPEDSRLATKDVYIVKPIKTDEGYKYEVVKTYNDVDGQGWTHS